MEFKTIVLQNKKSAVEIQALKKYDIDSNIPTILKNNDIFSIYKGTKFFDIISLMDPWNFAISEKFKCLLEENNITGWVCYPIIIQETNLKYYVLEIIGRAGLICEYDEDDGMVYGSLKVQKESWDGSDIFHVGDTGIIVCTNEVKDIIEKAKITNIEFDDLSKY